MKGSRTSEEFVLGEPLHQGIKASFWISSNPSDQVGLGLRGEIRVPSEQISQMLNPGNPQCKETARGGRIEE